jgi:hypothetical protein
MKKNDRKRHYLNIRLRKNSAKHKEAPAFITHSIRSEYLNEYIAHCVATNKPVCFDVAAFAVKTSADELVVTLSVPFFDKRLPTNLSDHFKDERETEDVE